LPRGRADLCLIAWNVSKKDWLKLSSLEERDAKWLQQNANREPHLGE